MSGEWLDVRVSRRWHETADVVVLELVAAGGGALPAFEAGAHIDVLGPAGHLRSYSLSNPPTERHRYEIAVLRDANGRGGSLALCDQVQPGVELRIRAPRNDFALHPYAVHSVLLAGGIGIAPLRSMVASLWGRGAPFELHYSARSPEKAAFLDDLLQCPYRLHVRFHESRACGHVDFGKILKPTSPMSEAYACGPSSFLAAVAAAFVAMGRSADRLHIESFAL